MVVDIFEYFGKFRLISAYLEPISVLADLDLPVACVCAHPYIRSKVDMDI